MHARPKPQSSQLGAWKPETYYVVAGIATIAVLVLGSVASFPASFALIRSTYTSLAEWAANRGEQIRRAFGIAPNASLRPEGNIGPETMSADRWNALKLAELAPAYRSRFSAFVAAAQRVARSHGIEFIIWDGARTLVRQVELYARGRTDDGAVVTHTTGGSRHLYGIAIDLAVRGRDGRVVFDLPSWFVDEVLRLAPRFRLSSLYLREGIDKPHIEVPKEDLPPSVKQAAVQISTDFPGLNA